MAARRTVADYLGGEETTRPRELVYGFVREPPAPFYRHQSVAFRLGRLLEDEVRRLDAGVVALSPLDVVLDPERALIVQPDVVFIAAARLGIIRDQIWGAPDLVAEVLSPRTARRDRTIKLGWYRRYGVRECWLADPRTRTVEVVGLTSGGSVRRFSQDAPLVSPVLPGLRLRASALFTP